jgi:hypothetical protein
MEQHPLISLGYGQNVTDFFSGPTIDIAHLQNQALGFWQRLESVIQDTQHFAAQ